MSISYRKKQLLHEAIGAYHQAKTALDWKEKLGSILVNFGWKIKHPGVEKWVAFKGPMVAKWIGRNSWAHATNPIKNEMNIYRVLRKYGLKKHAPKVYVCLGDFLVVQNLGKKTPRYWDLQKIERQLRDIGWDLVDTHPENAALFNGKIKIIDGKVRPTWRNLWEHRNYA